MQQFATYVAGPSPARLIGRLLFMQQEGAPALLVADKAAARQQWRRQHDLPANGRAEGEPQLISLCDVARESDAAFCALLAHVTRQQRQAELQGCGSESSKDSSAAVEQRYHAFIIMAQLPQLPAYQRLLAEGAAESKQLAALLPLELLPQPHGSA